MQFYPTASVPEERVHPGLCRRRRGKVDLANVNGMGLRYRAGYVHRDLPAAAAECA